MLKLIHFGPLWGLPDPSPFCVKVETYLRMAGIDYKARRGVPMRAPYGQLPYIVDGGQVVADSTQIIDHLRLTRGDALDSWLSDRQRNEGFFLEKAIEEYLYFLLVRERWLIPENFEIVKRDFFLGVPAPMRLILPYFVRHNAKRRVVRQGLGRRPEQELEHLTREMILKLSFRLGSSPYLMGDRPCWLDAVLYGFVVNLIRGEFPQGSGAFANQQENLRHYVDRMTQQYYPELSDGAGTRRQG